MSHRGRVWASGLQSSGGGCLRASLGLGWGAVLSEGSPQRDLMWAVSANPPASTSSVVFLSKGDVGRVAWLPLYTCEVLGTFLVCG